MKKLLLLLAVSLPLCLHAQARIGLTMDSVKKELDDRGLIWFAEASHMGDSVIVTERSASNVIYTFKHDRTCMTTEVFPITDSNKLFYIRMYDSLYIRISPTEWFVVTEGNYEIAIKLVNDDSMDMMPDFYWYRRKIRNYAKQ